MDDNKKKSNSNFSKFLMSEMNVDENYTRKSMKNLKKAQHDLDLLENYFEKDNDSENEKLKQKYKFYKKKEKLNPVKINGIRMNKEGIDLISNLKEKIETVRFNKSLEISRKMFPYVRVPKINCKNFENESPSFISNPNSSLNGSYFIQLDNSKSTLSNRSNKHTRCNELLKYVGKSIVKDVVNKNLDYSYRKYPLYQQDNDVRNIDKIKWIHANSLNPLTELKKSKSRINLPPIENENLNRKCSLFFNDVYKILNSEEMNASFILKSNKKNNSISNSKSKSNSSSKKQKKIKNKYAKLMKF